MYILVFTWAMNTRLTEQGENSCKAMNMSLLLYGCKYRTLRKNWGGKNMIFESSL